MNIKKGLRPIMFAGAVALFFLAACKHPAGQDAVVDKAVAYGISSGTVGVAVPFHKANIRYAHGFSIDYYPHFKIVRVLNRLVNTTDTLIYLLVPKGDPVPAGYPGAQVIRTPVQTIIGMSSMHIALAEFAGVTDRIIGLGSLDYANSPEVLKNIKAGKITPVGLDGNMNNELILTLHPDVLIAMGNPDAGFGRYKTLTDAGIPVLLNTDWLEATPLGRAEWVRLMGALVDKEAFVDRKFDSIAQVYNTLAQLSSTTTDRPHVIIGMPYKGSWFVPAGGSYQAQFLRDAGAGYKWFDSKGTGSLALNFETMAPEALEADFWLNTGYVDSKKDITDKDTRYRSFKSFRTNRIYNNNLRTNDRGSNDYWESGGVNPQIILADIIRILHPDLLPDHSLFYYKQLP